MTISMTCDSCGAQLRFGDQHAGKRIRCPKCQEILTAPAMPDEAAPAPAATRPASRTRNTPQTSSNPQRGAESGHRYNDEFDDYPREKRRGDLPDDNGRSAQCNSFQRHEFRIADRTWGLRFFCGLRWLCTCDLAVC